MDEKGSGGGGSGGDGCKRQREGMRNETGDEQVDGWGGGNGQMRPSTAPPLTPAAKGRGGRGGEGDGDQVAAPTRCACADKTATSARVRGGTAREGPPPPRGGGRRTLPPSLGQGWLRGFTRGHLIGQAPSPERLCVPALVNSAIWWDPGRRGRLQRKPDTRSLSVANAVLVAVHQLGLVRLLHTLSCCPFRLVPAYD